MLQAEAALLELAVELEAEEVLALELELAVVPATGLAPTDDCALELEALAALELEATAGLELELPPTLALRCASVAVLLVVLPAATLALAAAPDDAPGESLPPQALKTNVALIASAGARLRVSAFMGTPYTSVAAAGICLEPPTGALSGSERRPHSVDRG